jgi:competence protein ComEC
MANVQSIAWREIPLLRLLLPFGLGIYLGYAHFPELHSGQTGIGLAVAALCLLWTGRRALAVRQNRIWGLLALLWVFLFGLFIVQQANELTRSDHFAHQAVYTSDTPLFWSGRIAETRIGAKRVRVRLQVAAVGPDATSTTTGCAGHLLVYLPVDSVSSNLLPGQVVELQAKANRISSPLNPDAFDFSAWQARKGVYHQVYVDDGAWRLAATDVSLRGWAYQVREDLLAILRQYLPAGSNELAVASALILGKRDELSTDLRNAYAETGAVHVLAVSGLHLGFIAWGLGLLFGWGPFKQRSWRWIRLVLILAGIWIFALVTGLSPSVQRAATMFSFLWLGQTLGRRASIYNSLGASALLLLLIDPYLLFDIGFQLSYLALLGIVFFQPRLYRLWYSPYRIINAAWSLSTVAIAAQITTFPLSLYYFHQFPLYFLLSGLVVVFAASLILGLGIGLFLVSWWPFLAGLIAKLLYVVIWLNNAFIFRLQQLPGHLLSGIWINEWLLLLLFISIFFLAWYAAHRRTAYLLASLTALALALAVNLQTQVELSQQRSWIVYHLYKSSVIDAFDGRYRYTISELEADDPVLNWGIEPHRAKRGVMRWPDDKPERHWYARALLYGFYDRRLAIVNREWQAEGAPVAPLPVDVLVLQNSPRLQLGELLVYFQPEYWVVDGSNYPGQVEKWQTEADELDIKLHWTARDGAFRLNF